MAGKYRHWDILRHLEPPPDLSAEEWWLALKMARHDLTQELPLRDRGGTVFSYSVPPVMHQLLHEIDRDAAGRIRAAGEVSDARTGEYYLLNSLIEEPIASSQLEGAATTRRVAKEMLRLGRDPETRGERMILNNHRAMQFVRGMKEEPLTPELVFTIHRIVTEGTLDDPSAAGRLRRADLSDDDIDVVDNVGNVLHRPPDAAELEERMAVLCEFANATEPFVHPMVRAILLHLWLAYDHPFVDGNGRTARALFYWYTASRGYWLLEFVSISSILKRAPGKYARAFLYTETDENDATYFILNQLRVLRQAIDRLHGYLDRKIREARETERLLRRSGTLRDRLNHRQLALVNHALRNPGFAYTVQSHRGSHGVSYQTARTDLLRLADAELLEKTTVGKKFVFESAPNLRERLKRLDEER
ncbi:Fic family protein [soil metagenome]